MLPKDRVLYVLERKAVKKKKKAIVAHLPGILAAHVTESEVTSAAVDEISNLVDPPFGKLLSDLLPGLVVVVSPLRVGLVLGVVLVVQGEAVHVMRVAVII